MCKSTLGGHAASGMGKDRIESMENGISRDLEFLACLDKGSIGKISLDHDTGIGGDRFGIINFTRFIVVGANGGKCIVLCSDFFILLETGCDLVILHVRYVGNFIGELNMHVMLIFFFDALV